MVGVCVRGPGAFVRRLVCAPAGAKAVAVDYAVALAGSLVFLLYEYTNLAKVWATLVLLNALLFIFLCTPCGAKAVAKTPTKWVLQGFFYCLMFALVIGLVMLLVFAWCSPLRLVAASLNYFS